MKTMEELAGRDFDQEKAAWHGHDFFDIALRELQQDKVEMCFQKVPAERFMCGTLRKK